MRHTLIAAALFTAVTSVAVAQTSGSHPSDGPNAAGKPQEKQTTAIGISKQSGTASGERGSTGTRGSDSDSSITGRSRSPDIAYGANAANTKAGKTAKVTKHKAAKRSTGTTESTTRQE